MLKVGLLRTAVTKLQTERNLTGSKIIMLFLTFQLVISSFKKILNRRLGQKNRKLLNLILMRTSCMILIIRVLKTKRYNLDDARVRLNKNLKYI